jgi:YesN/AraC family two-component response regulator
VLKHNKIILAIDDDEYVLGFYKDWLGENIFTARDGQEGLEIIQKHKPDVVILDLNMPQMNGLELLKVMKDKYPDIAVIIVTGYFLPLNIMLSKSYGVLDCLTKPIDLDKLGALINKAT